MINSIIICVGTKHETQTSKIAKTSVKSWNSINQLKTNIIGKIITEQYLQSKPRIISIYQYFYSWQASLSRNNANPTHFIITTQPNKNMQNIKPFSRSLKKFIAKTNPQQREVTLFFQRSVSAQRLQQPTLPTILHNEHNQRGFSLVRRKTHSHKIQTEPSQPQNQQRQQKAVIVHHIGRQSSSLQEGVDDIMYSLINKGEANVSCSKQKKDQLDRKQLKNLRVVSEQPETQSKRKKKRRLEQHLDSIMIQQQIQREKKVRKKYIYQNPHIQKKVSTRWQASQSKGLSKQTLPYYPLLDMRQQNQQTLLSMPARTDEYMRRLRQTVFYKGRGY